VKLRMRAARSRVTTCDHVERMYEMRMRARPSSKSRAVSTIAVLDAAKAHAGVSILRRKPIFCWFEGHQEGYPNFRRVLHVLRRQHRRRSIATRYPPCLTVPMA